MNETIIKQPDYSGYYWQDDRIRLRAERPDDWEPHYHTMFDSRARWFLNSKIELPPVAEIVKQKSVDASNLNTAHGRLFLTIETLEGKYVGGLNLNSVDERNGTFSIGMQVVPEERGKGFGTAAMRILLRYAFLERRLNKYHGHVLEGNTTSATMLRKLGCRQEGVKTQMVFSNGRYWDEIHFGLTRSEFEDHAQKS